MISEDNLKLSKMINQALLEPTRIGTPMWVADAVKAEVEKIRKDNNVYVEKHWDFYQGKQADYFRQRPNEPNEVFEARKKNAVIVNYCEYIINLGSKYVYGKPQGIRRTFSTNKKTESRLRHLEKLNRTPEFMLKSIKQSGIFSEAIIRFVPVDEDSNLQAVGEATSSVYPRAVLLDPRRTFPLRNAWNKLIAVVINYKARDYVKGTDVEVKELVEADSRWVWQDDKLISAEVNTWALEEEFCVMINGVENKDDIQTIINLQTKLNESLTDAQHFFEKHGWPQLVTKTDLSQVTKSPGYIWHIESEHEGKVLDEIDFLTWDGKMKEARQHIQDLESFILKISSTAKMSTGDLEAIGQLRSGAAIVAAHGPSIQKAEEKQVVWRQNEINFFSAMARMDARLHGETVYKRFPEINIDVIFSDKFVPGEELIRAEIDSMSMNSHTTTIKDVQRRKFPTMTEEEIELKRKEIIDDSMELVDSKRAFLTEQSGQPIQSGQNKSSEQTKT